MASPRCGPPSERDASEPAQASKDDEQPNEEQRAQSDDGPESLRVIHARHASHVNAEEASQEAQWQEDARHDRQHVGCVFAAGEAARAQFFHYNTMRYRLAKIERLVGPVSSDARVRLDVAVALRVGG